MTIAFRSDKFQISAEIKNIHINNIKILYYDRIDVSKDINVTKTSASDECNICHYCYFLDKGFRFQSDVWNGCHGVLMSMKVNKIATLSLHGVDYYCIIINGISKVEAINFLKNVGLSEKRDHNKT